MRPRSGSDPDSDGLGQGFVLPQAQIRSLWVPQLYRKLVSVQDLSSGQELEYLCYGQDQCHVHTKIPIII